MAKSALEIRMDYSNAIRQADSLREIANNMRNMANGSFQDCISQIGVNWTGVNAAAYIKKCNQMREKILKTAQNVEQTATVIKQVAQNTYNAEMKALEFAKTRRF